MLAQSNKIKFEEFITIDSNTNDYLEFMDGIIYCQASPSTEHQSIVGGIYLSFGNYLKGKECKPFVSPFDIIFKNEAEIHRVQPDISIICDKSGLNENNYVGVPKLVVEVLSPSTMSKDFIKKMDLYMRFGVKEYWIVSPRNKEVQIFVLQDNLYSEMISFKESEILQSVIFSDLRINLKDIFS
jgi:Uma2 family endonuclease